MIFLLQNNHPYHVNEKKKIVPQEKLIFCALNHKEYKIGQHIVWDKCKAITITCIFLYIFSTEIPSLAVSDKKHSKLFLFHQHNLYSIESKIS